MNCLGILFRRPELLYRLDRRLEQAHLSPLSPEDFEYTDHQMLLRVIRQSLEQVETDHHPYVLRNLPESLDGLGRELLAQAKKPDPLEDRLLEELQRTIIKLRKSKLNESLNQLRFLQEEAQQQGDLRAASYQELVLNHTKMLRDLDQANRQLSQRRA